MQVLEGYVEIEANWRVFYNKVLEYFINQGNFQHEKACQHLFFLEVKVTFMLTQL